MYESRESSGETAFVAGHLCSTFLCLLVGKILTRLHLCTVSSEPSLVTYALYCVYESRESSDETALLAGHLYSIFVYVSREDFDETALEHSLI